VFNKKTKKGIIMEMLILGIILLIVALSMLDVIHEK
jgi:hypothetical protein